MRMMMMIMVMRDKMNLRPLLLKFGVVLALSFAGFLYTHFRTRRILPSRSPPLPPSPDDSNKVDSEGRTGLEDDLRDIQTTPSSRNDASLTPQNSEEASHKKVIITDNSVIGISPSSKSSKDEEGILLPEFNELVSKEFDLTANNSHRKDVEASTAFRKAADKEEMEQEIINLRNMVRVLQERERDLEIQLVEYYGLKEQSTAVMELQNRLKINNMEAKLFTLKIESLQADKRRLEVQVADYSLAMAELESARAKIKLLKRKIRSDSDQNKEQLSALQKRVANLRDQECNTARNDLDVQEELKKLLKDLGDETDELRRDNLILQHENSELSRRLECTQILASSVLEDPEAEALQEANHLLRQKNEDLAKEIERLQADRCADVEELVYLKWVNACLRYELRNYQPPPNKTAARDLGKTLSPKSEQKAKQLILEYANSEGIGDKDVSLMDFDSGYWSSSQSSNITESVGSENSVVDNSSATRSNNTIKIKFLNKLKKLVRGKDKKNRVASSNETTSYATLGRRESVSTCSFEEMVGTSSSDTLSPQHNSSISAMPLTGIEAGTELMNKISTPSQSSSRHSLDIQSLRNLNLEDIRGTKSIRSNSDVGSSNFLKRKAVGKDTVISLHQDNKPDHNPDTPEKLELRKYAEALKSSRGTRNSLRKSASFCSF